MKTKIFKTTVLLLFYSIVALSQTKDKAVSNNDVLFFANSEGGTDFIRIKKDSIFKHNEFFIKNKDAFKLSKNDDMRLINAKPDNLGYIHYLYQQSHNGILIEGAEYKLHELNGIVSTANGRILANMEKQTKPYISEEIALKNALKVINAKEYAWDVENVHSKSYSTPIGELVFTKMSDSLSFEQKNFVLAYKFDIFAIVPYSINYVYINAQTGEFIKKQSRIIKDCDCCNGTATTLYNGQRTIVTHHRWLTDDYILKDNCKGDGIHTSLLGSNLVDGDNQWSLTEERPATSAHWAAEMTYNYFYNIHGRNSFDNNGAAITLNISDEDRDNAFGTGSDFQFGKGNGGSTNNAVVSLDIVGHESVSYTHLRAHETHH